MYSNEHEVSTLIIFKGLIENKNKNRRLSVINENVRKWTCMEIKVIFIINKTTSILLVVIIELETFNSF